MVHKIKYFEADKLKPGIFLQDAVNDFLAEKDEKIIAVHPVMEKTLLVHYKEWWLSFHHFHLDKKLTYPMLFWFWITWIIRQRLVAEEKYLRAKTTNLEVIIKTMDL